MVHIPAFFVQSFPVLRYCGTTHCVMAKQLPLFPLQIVAYPGERVNLHIFEERYRELVRHMENEGAAFGIPTVIDGGLRPVATELELIEVANRYPGGECDIRVRGTGIVRIREFYDKAWGQGYPGGLVNELEYETREDLSLNRSILEHTQEIYSRLNIEREVPTDLIAFRTYDIAHYIGFTLAQEYEFLTLFKARDRQEYMLEHLRNLRPDVSAHQRLRERAKLNGHFRELQPPNF